MNTVTLERAITGSELQQALDALGMTQVEAADRLGVVQSTMFRWTKDRRAIPGPVVEAVRGWFRERGLLVPSWLK